MFVLRTITAAVLFVCMLVPLLTPVYLQLKQLHIQHEMLEELEMKSLISVRVKKEMVNWVKPGKECMIGAEMFDVKHIQQDGDMLLLTGLYDAKEKQLKRLAAATAQQQSKQSRYCIKLLSLVVLVPESLSTQPQMRILKASYPLFHKSPYFNPYIEFLKPPPRFA